MGWGCWPDTVKEKLLERRKNTRRRQQRREKKRMRRRERMPAGRRGWEDRLAQLRMQKTWLLSWLLILIARRCLDSLSKLQKPSPISGTVEKRGAE